jgi:hypothetical protein
LNVARPPVAAPRGPADGQWGNFAHIAKGVVVSHEQNFHFQTARFAAGAREPGRRERFAAMAAVIAFSTIAASPAPAQTYYAREKLVAGTAATAPAPTAPHPDCGGWTQYRIHDETSPSQYMSGANAEDLLRNAAEYCKSVPGTVTCQLYSFDPTSGIVSAHPNANTHALAPDSWLGSHIFIASCQGI